MFDLCANDLRNYTSVASVRGLSRGAVRPSFPDVRDVLIKPTARNFCAIPNCGSPAELLIF